MCETCGCEGADKPVKYRCACGDEDCGCDSIVEFDSVPKERPYCCGKPMERME